MSQHEISLELSKARESRSAIEKLYIEMRHVFNSGSYRPADSGAVLREALLTLSPEIYGSMVDTEKVELNGLVYVIDRLPKGIEECRFIRLIAEEGLGHSNFEVIIPAKRRRNCYRIDSEQMLIEITRGRSEVYDLLTHLTFLYNEAEKIRRKAFDRLGNPTREWLKLEQIVLGERRLNETNKDIAFAYLSYLLGRTFAETKQAYERFKENMDSNNGLFHLVYWLGKLVIAEQTEGKYREISFSPTLRERIGHHIHGERWANQIKHVLHTYKLINRPIHIISANLHSVMNTLYAVAALQDRFDRSADLVEVAIELSKGENSALMDLVRQYAEQHGMYTINDQSGTNIHVQLFDLSVCHLQTLPTSLKFDKNYVQQQKPLLLVMDYAFGEQAFETMDELLKPYELDGQRIPLNVESISIMGKAGILQGDKGDIMIPHAHIFEGTADNYPFDNDFTVADFANSGVQVFEGSMVTVMGTSLQNRDVLTYFKDSSWHSVGLEMEGAHYQKAIQAAAKIRKNISEHVVTRYAYYASDNPLLTGSTLASGSLGLTGVRPTYQITLQILLKILTPKATPTTNAKAASKDKSGTIAAALEE
ncbi:DUF6909 family protein [Eisenibacter elegans]|jgi:hypothetical protein|uniref:DUF6909 family protein n=1 Tax=Eisenibacter elegans TaxID=997 RepID=UPI00041CA5CB|nr:hypothetical protein [Eisenibacter elegans]